MEEMQTAKVCKYGHGWKNIENTRVTVGRVGECRGGEEKVENKSKRECVIKPVCCAVAAREYSVLKVKRVWQVCFLNYNNKHSPHWNQKQDRNWDQNSLKPLKCGDMACICVQYLTETKTVVIRESITLCNMSACFRVKAVYSLLIKLCSSQLPIQIMHGSKVCSNCQPTVYPHSYIHKYRDILAN